MFVLKNIGPLKIKGKVVCRFMIGKPVPEMALKHWGDGGIQQLEKAGIIGKQLPKEEKVNEPVRQNESGQQANTQQGVRGSNDNQEQGGASKS